MGDGSDAQGAAPDYDLAMLGRKVFKNETF